MRKKLLYIFPVLIGLLCSCAKDEHADQKPIQGTEIGNEATISFSAVVPSNPNTKAMGQDPTDFSSMHLVVFDANGMYVETRKAVIGSSKTHDGHNYETTFSVTLTVTDQPRVIHFIANCPVEQIVYGHEASIIGNMYVTKSSSNLENKTAHETSYWARIEVPHIFVVEKSEGSGEYLPATTIADKFTCIPMLRNFAQIVVKDSPNTTEFEYLGFTLYNTIDIGTIAPYNNTTQSFQNFVNPETGKTIKYPNLDYSGHALAAADLNTSLELDSNSDDGYKWYNESNPFFMYERKISVKTDEEEKWSESPPHIIIKGRYGGKINYYKVDLVYNVYGDPENPSQVTDIVYYNILRNFKYQFTISAVSGEGYPTVPDAVNGSTSNNLSGSATTSKFTNISDEVGRIFVSYTDTTLVSNDPITFRYKYIPNLAQHTVVDNDLVANDGPIELENILGGDIVSSYRFATNDDSEFTQHIYDSNGNIASGEWQGYRELILTINSPEDMTKDQILVVRTDNANLSRNVRLYLKKRYNLEVECTPKVEARIGAPVEVDIKLPIGVTEDMFPLDLDIEVYDMTLAPDAVYNSIPVFSGPSTIASKYGVNTFHYVKTIETKEEYDALQTVGTQKILKTYWLTNIADNESTIYVSNKYFEVASDSFVNAKSLNGRFSKSSIGVTDNLTVDYLFDVSSIADQPVFTVTLDRLEPIYSGSGLVSTGEPGVYTYTPQTVGTQTIKLQASEHTEGVCTISITSDDSFGYANVSDKIQQMDKISITDKTVILEFVLDHGSTNNYTVTTTVTANDNSEISFSSSFDRTNQEPSDYTVTINNLNITGAELTTEITFSSRLYRSSNRDYTYSKTLTVEELLNLFKNTSSVTFNLGTK